MLTKDHLHFSKTVGEASSPEREAPSYMEKLSVKLVRPRHREIMRRICCGQTLREIAEDLNLSESRLYIITHSPLFKIELKKMERDIQAKAIDSIGDVSVRIAKLQSPAIDVLEEIVVNPRKKEIPLKLRKDAAMDVLNMAGAKRKTNDDGMSDFAQFVSDAFNAAKDRALDRLDRQLEEESQAIDITPEEEEVCGDDNGDSKTDGQVHKTDGGGAQMKQDWEPKTSHRARPIDYTSYLPPQEHLEEGDPDLEELEDLALASAQISEEISEEIPTKIPTDSPPQSVGQEADPASSSVDAAAAEDSISESASISAPPSQPQPSKEQGDGGVLKAQFPEDGNNGGRGKKKGEKGEKGEKTSFEELLYNVMKKEGLSAQQLKELFK